MKSLILNLILFLPFCLFAQWPGPPPAEPYLPIDSTQSKQFNPYILADGNGGGSVILWTDRIDNGPYHNIKMQKLNANGLPQWTTNGITVQASSVTNINLGFVAVGDGSYLVIWEDHFNGDFNVLAQRVSPSGNMMWGQDVQLSYNPGAQMVPVACSDGEGGAIIAWRDSPGIFAQKIDSSGVVAWGINGVQASTTSAIPSVVSDGQGGGIFAWSNGDNIIAERILDDGTVDWGTVVVCNASGVQNALNVCEVSGGAVIAWEDYRNTTPMNQGPDVYAQRLDLDGTDVWENNGITVCDEAWSQDDIQIAADDNDGVFICWVDARESGGGFDRNIYLQHILSNGSEDWQQGGITVSDLWDPQTLPDLFVKDNEALVTWSQPDILVQKVDINGNLLWGMDGRYVVPGFANPYRSSITTDQDGGAILAIEAAPWYWDNEDIIANQVLDEINLPVELSEFHALLVDQQIHLKWTTLSEVDHDYFKLEKSRDGKSFHTLQQIPASQFGGQMNHYDYLDKSPFVGTNYYRLKQVDLNGVFSYSDIVSVDFSLEKKISVFPNPANDVIHITFEKGDINQFAIFDAHGKKVRVLESSDQQDVQIDISDLLPGFYLISINKENRIETKAFVKAGL